MKLYSVICPFCSKENRNLYLEETHWCMECEACGEISRNLRVGTETSESCFISIPILKEGVSA